MLRDVCSEAPACAWCFTASGRSGCRMHAHRRRSVALSSHRCLKTATTLPPWYVNGNRKDEKCYIHESPLRSLRESNARLKRLILS